MKQIQEKLPMTRRETDVKQEKQSSERWKRVKEADGKTSETRVLCDINVRAKHYARVVWETGLRGCR